jgi:hypothetical protein
MEKKTIGLQGQRCVRQRGCTGLRLCIASNMLKDEEDRIIGLPLHVGRDDEAAPHECFWGHQKIPTIKMDDTCSLFQSDTDC